MRKLFLTSAGLPKETRDYFIKLLLPKKPEEISVAFIPTAAYPEVDKSFIQKSLDELKEIGIKQVEEIDLKNEDKESLLAKLSKADVIYVNGGNTFYLLDWTRKSGFDQIISQLLDDGKIYVGTSAGSIIAGPDIESAGWEEIEVFDKNIVHLKDTTGMNLVPFVVSPHFVEKDRKFLESKSKTVSYTIIALHDSQAVLYIDNKYEIVGKGEEIICNSSNLL